MRRFRFPIRGEKLILPGLATGFFGFGMLFLFFTGQVWTLTCTRDALQQVNCTHRATWMGINSLPLQEVQRPGLQRAVLEPNCDEDGCTYRVILATRYGDVPLSDLFTSEQKKHQTAADQINAYLENEEQQALEVRTGGGGWGLILPGIFLAVGIFLAGLTYYASVHNWI